MAPFLASFVCWRLSLLLIAELSRARSARRGGPWVRKFGYLCIQEILVLTKSSVRSTYAGSPLHVSRIEILHFNYPRVLAVNRIATRTFREKATTRKPILSFDLILMTRKLQMNPPVIWSLSSTLCPSSWCFLSTKGEQKVRFWCFIYYSIITCAAFNLKLSVTSQANPSVLVVFSSRPCVLVVRCGDFMTFLNKLNSARELVKSFAGWPQAIAITAVVYNVKRVRLIVL